MNVEEKEKEKESIKGGLINQFECPTAIKKKLVVGLLGTILKVVGLAGFK
ncbi:hypothetical protein IC619_011720 [Hazenella sp. IB182353]|nr:hypothetical protein [Polycladospora coralii]MBS7531164.1 hypothetical protein [Polycladospora coralii]